MKLIGLLLALAPFALNAQREPHIRFNLLIDRARTAAVEGDHFTAMACYDTAFGIVPWRAGHHFDAAIAAIAAGRPDKASAYLLNGVENGLDLAPYTDPDLDRFLTSEASAPFREQQERCRDRFIARADTATMHRIEAMAERDQSVRDGSAMMLHNDSLNFEELITICHEQGFPSEKTIGPNAVWMLLWHHRGAEYPDSPQWRRILPFIHTAMDEGRLDPAFLCMFDDLHDQDTGHPMRYGALLGYYREMPEALLLVAPEELRRNRGSVGWGPIEDFAIQVGVDPARIRYAGHSIQPPASPLERDGSGGRTH